MSAELRAYSMSLGAILAETRDESGMAGAVTAILDARDADHLTRYGHLPGGRQDDGRPCTLAPRADAVVSAMAEARSEARAVLSGTSQQIVDEINRRAPWINASVSGPDPDVVRARAGLAAKMARLHAGTLP